MTRLTFSVRRAASCDLNALKTILEENGIYRDASYWQQSQNRMAADELDIFIAQTEQGGVIGYGFLNWQPKYRVYQQLNIPEIQDLNVLPDYRRRGVARAIIAECEEMARKEGRTQIGISYGLTRDFGPAQILYNALGYVPDGFGVTYDREPVNSGQVRAIDDDLCLMLVKDL